MGLGFAAVDTFNDAGAHQNAGAFVVVFMAGDWLWTYANGVQLPQRVPSCAGTRIWLQLDVDTREVRLRLNTTDLGVIHTLPADFPLPVSPYFANLPGGSSFELLTPLDAIW